MQKKLSGLLTDCADMLKSNVSSSFRLPVDFVDFTENEVCSAMGVVCLQKNQGSGVSSKSNS